MLIGLGSFATVLGALGVALPLLPTTPFLLLAAACFARSSPRFHRRLRSSPVFGPYLRQWRRERTVPPRAKRRAIVLVLASFALAIALADPLWLRALLVLLALALALFLARLPEPRHPSKDRSGVQVLDS